MSTPRIDHQTTTPADAAEALVERYGRRAMQEAQQRWHDAGTEAVSAFYEQVMEELDVLGFNDGDE